jgi:hypothetical protein
VQYHHVHIGPALVLRTVILTMGQEADHGVTDGPHDKHNAVADNIEQEPVIELKIVSEQSRVGTTAVVHI